LKIVKKNQLMLLAYFINLEDSSCASYASVRSASAASEHDQAVKPAVLRAFAWGLVNPRSPAAGSLASCHLAGQSVVVILMGCSAGLPADADLL